jgi:hypothetical protein
MMIMMITIKEKLRFTSPVPLQLAHLQNFQLLALTQEKSKYYFNIGIFFINMYSIIYRVIPKNAVYHQ